MTIAVRFKCSGCGSSIPTRIKAEHRELFREKVVEGTCLCDRCKRDREEFVEPRGLLNGVYEA
jgi:hypothetical protein